MFPRARPLLPDHRDDREPRGTRNPWTSTRLAADDPARRSPCCAAAPPADDHDTVEVLIGPVHEAERLADLPSTSARPRPRPLPADPRARLRRPRRRDAAERAGRRGVVRDPARRGPGGSFPRTTSGSRAAASTSTTRSTRRSSGGCCGTRSAAGEGANFVIRRTYEGRDPRLRPRRRARAVPAAAGGRAGRVLDVRRAHRGAHAGRGQPRGARADVRRDGRDEPDQRDVPLSGRGPDRRRPCSPSSPTARRSRSCRWSSTRS